MLPRTNKLGWKGAMGWAGLAVASFHLAYELPNAPWLFVMFFFSLFNLARLSTARAAFYVGVAIGLAVYAPQLRFFWNIFQIAAIPLWVVLSIWLGLFLSLGQFVHRRFGWLAWGCAAPFLWMGIEYFRSELYYLKFTWMNAGFAFSTSPLLPWAAHYGVYGIGFVLMAIAAWAGTLAQLRWRARVISTSVVTGLVLLPLLLANNPTASGRGVRFTGVQMEFPSLVEVRSALDHALSEHPDTDLFVLSEYTFTGPIPKQVLQWCAKHQKYLAVGGEDPMSSTTYFNTVFVIDPSGKIVFRQAKSVPIQFFKDGLPATNQMVWTSPWGKLGFAICYDASYSRVIDGLVRLGAQALVFPTMDVEDWGARQHRLHARVAPMRAAEYGLPVFRLCSSGISQAIDASGHVKATGSFPGSGEILSAELTLPHAGQIPPDRYLAPGCVVVAFGILIFAIVDSRKGSRKVLPPIT